MQDATSANYLKATAAGLDLVNRALALTSQPNIPAVDPALRAAVAQRLGPEAEQDIYDGAVRMAQSIQVLDAAAINQYLLTGGTSCPSCLSSNIEGGSIDIDQGRAWQNVSCTECGLEWTDGYQLVGVSEVTFATRRGKEGRIQEAKSNT
jgi:hypothetical protein